MAGYSRSNDGDVSGNHGGDDYWVVKLSPEDGISDGNKGLQPRVHTISAFPNPFNSSCAISAPAGAEVEVWDLRGLLVGRFDRLTDRSGEPVAELAEATAISTFIWSPAASLPSGIYLVKATTQDGRQITKRIAYIR